jgi:hydroxyacylglutathione hydrolase
VALRVTGLTLGPLQTNCYVLSDDATGAAVIVDPADEAARIRAALADAGLRPAAIWLTHAHFDHVGAVADLVETASLPVYLHPDDRPLYDHASEQAAGYGLTLRAPRQPTEPLQHGQQLYVGAHAAVCRHTPGHAPGHVSFVFEEAGAAISGDALFAGSIGRTDLMFGDHELLLRSIREQLMSLPDETVVHPGHGPSTTVGVERRTNPFLLGLA